MLKKECNKIFYVIIEYFLKTFYILEASSFQNTTKTVFIIKYIIYDTGDHKAVIVLLTKLSSILRFPSWKFKAGGLLGPSH